LRLLSSVAQPVYSVGRDSLPDSFPDCGPLGGIATALQTSTSDANLVVAVDLPLLSPSFLRWFVQRIRSMEKLLIACSLGEEYPLCIGIHRDLKRGLESRTHDSDLAVHRWIEASDPEIIPESELRSAGFAPSMFHNINTPQEWRQIKPG